MFTSLNPDTLAFSAPLDEALQLAHSNGFAALDLPLNELLARAEQGSVQEILERFQAEDIRPGGWGLPLEFRTSEEAYRTSLEKLPQYAGLAQQLGSPWCFTWILPFSDTLDYAANMEHHVQRLRPAAQILADHNIRLGLEFVGPKTLRANHPYTFIHTIAGALELGEQIGTGNTGLLLDCWHWYTSQATVEDITRLSAEQVVYVHVNDAPQGLTPDAQIDKQRLLPGASGVIDIIRFLQALTQIGYTGPIVAEPFNAEVNSLPPAERVQRTGESMRAIMQQAHLPTQA